LGTFATIDVSDDNTKTIHEMVQRVKK